ncbi:MAG: hydrolase [Bacteroidota bacterium]
MRIQVAESAALVIDIQERLFPHIAGHEQLLERVKILIAGMEILGVPVLVTEQYRKGLGETLPQISTMIRDFSPVEKMAFSCCDEPAFFSSLKESGRQKVIICGIETHVCVLQTTIDLFAAGYQPVVIADAVSSRNPLDREIALQRMSREGAIISTVESILFELARVSGTETFKAISRLVK